MNENLNLVEILKDCPKGTKLYSSVFGEVELDHIDTHTNYTIVIRLKNLDVREWLTTEGTLFKEYDGECILFPSREERDWSKFKLKKDRFDPKTLNAFDKVLIRDSRYEDWRCDIFSHIHNRGDYHFRTITAYYAYCIPYNNETKHLVGTNDEAPEYYRYWED